MSTLDKARLLPLHDVRAGRCSCGKADCATPGKHPRITRWPEKATADETTIKDWWAMWPDANTGIVTGGGIAVLDVDPRHGGDQALADLEKRHGALPVTATVATGGGGRHFYFNAPADTRSHDLAPGLELKAKGSFVVAPPSIHASGKQYTWLDRAPLVELPDWLRASKRRNGSATPIPSKVPVGQRNNTLTSLAGTMRRKGMNQGPIETALLAVNSEFDHPLDADEVAKIAASVSRYKPHENTSAAPARFTLKFDEKGKPILPPTPAADDIDALCAWLTVVFNLSSLHPITGGAHEGPRGPEGHAVLYRAGALPLRFEPAKALNTPQRLIEQLNWRMIPSDGAVHALDGAACRKISHLVRVLCKSSAAISEAEQMRGAIGALLQVAVLVEGYTCHGTTQQRYEAALALRHCSGLPRYLIDSETGEIVDQERRAVLHLHRSVVGRTLSSDQGRRDPTSRH
jgi:hypothetical protein